MTIPEPETSQQPEAPSEPKAPAQYQVSFERLIQLKRSATNLVAGRRPLSCPSRQRPDHELTDAKKLVDEVADHCADDEGFIRTEMPVQEIVFRTLLARRNAPIPLSDLLYELTDRWATPVRPITLTEDGLARILDADTYYGFVRVTPADG